MASTQKLNFFILIPTHVATIFPYLSQLDKKNLTPSRFENDPCRFENHYCEFKSIFKFLVGGIEIHTCGFEIDICSVQNMACCLELILVRFFVSKLYMWYRNFTCCFETTLQISEITHCHVGKPGYFRLCSFPFSCMLFRKSLVSF